MCQRVDAFLFSGSKVDITDLHTHKRECYTHAPFELYKHAAAQKHLILKLRAMRIEATQ